MAKKATRSPPQARGPTPSEGLNRERFEKELQDLAQKAKRDSERSKSVEQSKVFLRSALLLVLLGVYAVVSQRALSPVYGDIPSSLMHTKLLMGGSFVGWAGNLFLRKYVSMRTVELLPYLAAYIPVIQFYAYSFSERLGAQWGPAATEGLTLVPLCILTASSVADLLEDADLSFLPDFIADATPGIGSWGLFKLSRNVAVQYLQMNAGKGFLWTRLGLETILAGIYAVAAPSKYLYLAIPALVHTAFFNTHLMTPMATTALNSTLQAENYLLLDRKESVTGYISVLESLDKGFRVLRCDHSLLGGEWVTLQGQPAHEPIYGVFVLLEAVRLVKREHRVLDKDANALVV